MNAIKKLTGITFIILLLTASHLYGKSYNDLKGGFTIQAPDNWSASAMEIDGGSGLKLTSPDKGITVTVESRVPKPYASVESMERDFSINHPNRIPLSPLREQTINGIKGKIKKYLVRTNEQDYELSVFFTLANGRAYLLTARVPKQQAETRLWEINNVTSTFTVANKYEIKRYNSSNHYSGKPAGRTFRMIDAMLADSILPNGQPHKKSIFDPGQTLLLIVRYSGSTHLLTTVWKNESTGDMLRKDTVGLSYGNSIAAIPLVPPVKAFNEGRYSILLYRGSQLLKRLPFSVVNRSAYYNYRALIPENHRVVLETGQAFDFNSQSVIDGTHAGTAGIVVYKNCSVTPLLEGNFFVTDERRFNRLQRYNLPVVHNQSLIRRAVPLNRVCVVPLANGSYREFMITGQNYDRRSCTQSIIITLKGNAAGKERVYYNR